MSDGLRHFFHKVSNVRPIIWICVYLVNVPLFALFYSLLSPGEFRIPDGGTGDFGAWLYYSIVTLTTLGFGDYTPMGSGAQIITAVEVLCGLVVIGLFLNAVGAMKSEIDVTSEIEKQRAVHNAAETAKLKKTIPIVMHNLNRFLAYCYAVTTPYDKRDASESEYDASFSFNDMRDLYRPSRLPIDHSYRPAVAGLRKCAESTSLYLDMLQNRVDLTLWPELLEDCFSFVARVQMFTDADNITIDSPGADGKRLPEEQRKEHEHEVAKAIAEWNGAPVPSEGNPLNPYFELYDFIKKNAAIAEKIETFLTSKAFQTEE